MLVRHALQRLRRKFTKLPSVVSGELPHMPEAPSIGDVRDGLTLTGGSEVAAGTDQPLRLEVGLGRDPEALVEPASKRSFGGAGLAAQVLDRVDLVGPFSGDANGRFNQPLPAALRGSAIGHAASSKTLNEQVARVPFDGSGQGMALDEYPQSGRNQKAKVADDRGFAGRDLQAPCRTFGERHP